MRVATNGTARQSSRATFRTAAVGLLAAVAFATIAAVPAAARTRVERSPHQVVYTSDANGTFDIWVVRPDGSQPRVLMSTPAADIQPAISSDGRQLAYVETAAVSCCGPAATVVVTDLPTTGPPTPIIIPGVADTYRPAWSPDGTRIAATSARDGTTRIWVMNADGANAHPITTPPNGADTAPAWSPTGDRIAFRSTRDGSGEIYTVAPDGTGLRRVTNDTYDDRYPTWTPDGRTLIYASIRAPRPVTCPSPGLATCDSILVRANRDGGQQQALTQPGSHADFPAIAPTPDSR